MNSTITHTDAIRDALDRPTWLSPSVWPFAIRRHEHTRADGTNLTIHYTDEGRGPTLVFVHAGMWSFIWRDAIAALRSEFRCITLDFPGTGLSEGTGRDIDLSDFAAIVTDLLDHCHVEQATFIVHDLGGVVGVAAAAAHPERVVGLVATNSFAWPPSNRILSTMLGIMGSRPGTGLLGTVRLIPRMTRSTMGVGRHFDRPDRRAFFGPYRKRGYGRNFHRAMRSARRSTDLYERAERALETTPMGTSSTFEAGIEIT